MNILHIITDLANGGAEATLYKLLSNRPPAGTRHHVVSLRGLGKYGPMLLENGVDVHTIKIGQENNIFIGLYSLYKIVKNINPDLVQTWLYHADLIGGLVSRVAGVKKVYWGVRHSNLSVGKLKFRTILIAKLGALLSWFLPYKIISCSSDAVISHIKFGYNKNKFIVINNGYDFSVFYPEFSNVNKVKDEFCIPLDIPLIGMVARFDMQKDHYNLLMSLSYILNKNIKFLCVLVGDGMTVENNKLMRWINELSLSDHVRLLGVYNDIPSIMNMLDIHVLSSLGEAFPNVVAEAMACATPCIATDVGDSKYIIGNTGWIVPAEDPVLLSDSLFNALNEMNNSYSWEDRKVKSRNRIIENYSIDKMCIDFYKTWEIL